METSPRRRVLTKDLDARINELEKKTLEITEQLLKLDERIQKIANTIAEQVSRWGT
jgi:chaperonin cofactor prefoldin